MSTVGRTCPACGSARWIQFHPAGQPDEPAGPVERACRACGTTWEAVVDDEAEASDG